MDPALWEILDGDADDEVEAIIRLRRPGHVPQGVRLVARFGESIATCRLRRGSILEVRADETCASLKAPRLLAPDFPVEVSEAGAPEATRFWNDVRRPKTLDATGRGVVLGVVDWGADFAHPNFRNADGTTRLLALWDQRQPRRTDANPYGYGTVHETAEIDLALDHDDPYDALGYHPADGEQDGKGAHGTHVMDIAAGNGRAGTPPVGIAPEVDLIFVHLATRGTGGLANLGDAVTLLEAVDFILKTADGSPCCINLSMGRHGGPHDGTTAVELAIDALLEATPNVFVSQSTGNYFQSHIHAAGQVQQDATRSLEWWTDAADRTPNELEVWYSGDDAFGFVLQPPDSEQGFRVPLGERGPVEVDGETVGRIYHRSSDPNNADNHINVFLDPSAPPGPWHIVLEGRQVVDDGIFDAWVERDATCRRCQSRFSAEDADTSSTTGTICNGRLPLVVGAYDAHSPGRELGVFSSAGPTRDGRPKPDLLAPGVKVLAARSAPRDAVPDPEMQIRKSGTSMAAPHVAGAMAAIVGIAPRLLTMEEMRGIILSSVQPVAHPNGDDRRSGAGYLDIDAAIREAHALAASETSQTHDAREQAGAPSDEADPAPRLDSRVISAHDGPRTGDGEITVDVSEPALCPREDETVGEKPTDETIVEDVAEVIAQDAAETDTPNVPVGSSETLNSNPIADALYPAPETPEAAPMEPFRQPSVPAMQLQTREAKTMNDETTGSELAPTNAIVNDVQAAAPIDETAGKTGEVSPESDLMESEADLGVEQPIYPGKDELWEDIPYPEQHSAAESLVDQADAAVVDKGPTPSAVDWLGALLQAGLLPESLHPLGARRFPAPATLFDAFAVRLPGPRRQFGQSLEVVALPGERLAESLQPGDLLVRHSLEGPFAHLALLATGELFWAEQLGHAGLRPEGWRSGVYAHVVEGGAFPHGRADGFARRLAGEDHRLDRGHLILRFRPETLARLQERDQADTGFGDTYPESHFETTAGGGDVSSARWHATGAETTEYLSVIINSLWDLLPYESGPITTPQHLRMALGTTHLPQGDDRPVLAARAIGGTGLSVRTYVLYFHVDSIFIVNNTYNRLTTIHAEVWRRLAHEGTIVRVFGYASPERQVSDYRNEWTASHRAVAVARALREWHGVGNRPVRPTFPAAAERRNRIRPVFEGNAVATPEPGQTVRDPTDAAWLRAQRKVVIEIVTPTTPTPVPRRSQPADWLLTINPEWEPETITLSDLRAGRVLVERWQVGLFKRGAPSGRKLQYLGLGITLGFTIGDLSELLRDAVLGQVQRVPGLPQQVRDYLQGRIQGAVNRIEHGLGLSLQGRDCLRTRTVQPLEYGHWVGGGSRTAGPTNELFFYLEGPGPELASYPRFDISGATGWGLGFTATSGLRGWFTNDELLGVKSRLASVMEGVEGVLQLAERAASVTGSRNIQRAIERAREALEPAQTLLTWLNEQHRPGTCPQPGCPGNCFHGWVIVEGEEGVLPPPRDFPSQCRIQPTGYIPSLYPRDSNRRRFPGARSLSETAFDPESRSDGQDGGEGAEDIMTFPDLGQDQLSAIHRDNYREIDIRSRRYGQEPEEEFIYLDCGRWGTFGGHADRHFGLIYGPSDGGPGFAAICQYTGLDTRGVVSRQLQQISQLGTSSPLNRVLVQFLTNTQSELLQIASRRDPPKISVFNGINTQGHLIVLLGDLHLPVWQPGRPLPPDILGGDAIRIASQRLETLSSPIISRFSGLGQLIGQFGQRTRTVAEQEWQQQWCQIYASADIFGDAADDLYNFLGFLERDPSIQFVQAGDMFELWVGLPKYFSHNREDGIVVQQDKVQIVSDWIQGCRNSAIVNGNDLIDKFERLGVANKLWIYGNHDNYLRSTEVCGRANLSPRYMNGRPLWDQGMSVWIEHGHNFDSANRDRDSADGWAITQAAFLAPDIRVAQSYIYENYWDRDRNTAIEGAVRKSRDLTRGSRGHPMKVFAMGHTHAPFLSRIKVHSAERLGITGSIQTIER